MGYESAHYSLQMGSASVITVVNWLAVVSVHHLNLGSGKRLTLGACFVYNSTVNEPTEVSNVTNAAAGSAISMNGSVVEAEMDVDAVDRSKQVYPEQDY